MNTRLADGNSVEDRNSMFLYTGGECALRNHPGNSGKGCVVVVTVPLMRVIVMVAVAMIPVAVPVIVVTVLMVVAVVMVMMAVPVIVMMAVVVLMMAVIVAVSMVVVVTTVPMIVSGLRRFPQPAINRLPFRIQYIELNRVNGTPNNRTGFVAQSIGKSRQLGKPILHDL